MEQESIEQGVDRKELWQRQQAIRLENIPRLHDRMKTQYSKGYDDSRFDGAEMDIRYYTQFKHRAFSDHAKRLQRGKFQQVRDIISQPHKRHSELER